MGATQKMKGRAWMVHVVVQVSDSHISPTHRYFIDNWRSFDRLIRSAPPDLVIHSGDFSFNGPLDKVELPYAREAADALGAPWLAIPGNHDIGAHDSKRKQISSERLAHWKQCFGDDRFIQDIEDWRLIGIDGELLGSTLPEEAEQWSFLEQACSLADGREIAVFTHRPLFANHPEEPASRWSMPPEPRWRLLDILRAHRVRLVASGHLHRYRIMSFEGIDLVWCPTTAFITPSTRNDGCIRRVGYLRWIFQGRTVRHEFVEPETFVNHDKSWKNRHMETAAE